ncbi:diaminopimelate decarboxylase [Candidatus Micrarchaeota archaeon]|nr:diaminopimelate decarboxylase [Candidatus Micrarchaeota archaeon]MBU1930215.1 diaminopimelate decarboxylase [Candidatus Micrarchaeota archaeon]
MKASSIAPGYLRDRWRFAKANRKGELVLDGVPANQIAQKYGTPVYVLVESEIRDRLRRMRAAFSYPKLCLQFAGKCNSNLEILRLCREEGFELDASSVGEIILGLLADFTPEEITFTNLFKSDNDIAFAAQIGVAAITADSLEELERMNHVGQRIGTKIKVFVRINPEIELGNYSTKKHKYGIPLKQAKKAILFVLKAKHLEIVGLHFHGSYINDPKAYFLAAEKLLKLAAFSTQKGRVIQFIDLGGGFPTPIGNQKVFEPEDFGQEFSEFFEKTCRKLGIPLPTLILEPGKFIVRSAGLGLMRVVSKKPLLHGEVLVTDGSAYSFLPDVLFLNEKFDFLPLEKMNKPKTNKYDLAGCTCDNIDVLAEKTSLPQMKADDLLAVMDCGAYTHVLTSNFNTVKRAPMVMVHQNQIVKLIRRRDRFSEMFAPELDVLKVADPAQLMRYYNLHRVNIDKIWRDSKNNNGKNHQKVKREKTKSKKRKK